MLTLWKLGAAASGAECDDPGAVSPLLCVRALYRDLHQVSLCFTCALLTDPGAVSPLLCVRALDRDLHEVVLLYSKKQEKTAVLLYQ